MRPKRALLVVLVPVLVAVALHVTGCTGEETTASTQAASTTSQAMRATTETVTDTETVSGMSSDVYRGNLRRTGVYSTGGPTGLPRPVWRFGVPGGVTASPVIADGVVYFGGGDCLYAVDAQSGQEKWKFRAEDAVRFAPEVYGRTVYVGSDEYLYAVDVQSGQEEWKRLLDSGVWRTTPAVWGGVVYCGACAVDSQTGQLLWSLETGGAVGSCVSISGGILYFGVGGWMNGLYAVRVDGAPPVSGSGLHPFFSSNEPAPTGIQGAVAILADSAYFASMLTGHYYAVDTQTGQERWRFKSSEIPQPDDPGYFLPQGTMVSPGVSDGLLYGGSEGGYLYAVDTETGQERWRFSKEITGMSSPAISGEVLYVGSKDGYLYALDTETGQEEWKFKTGGVVSSSPAIADGLVYVGSDDGYLYALQ